jgi:valyl-tRNA synthetase
MSEIAKTYEPAAVEAKWYDFWLQHGCFKGDPARVSDTRPAYSIVIPPPNVTGVLTLGHVLNNTIQDILARRARMQGKEVLWLPGTDHAGIATQTVVERTLKKQGVIRHRDDLGREKFLEKVWEWKDKHGGIIIQQLKKLGASCDWSRERFTMDPDYSRCVQRVFVDLYKKGLIYRGKRMVNWCPASLTALSDEEVVMKPQNGTMFHFKVEVMEGTAPSVPSPSVGGSDGALPSTIRSTDTWLTIATTRPETIPGDTAVAVNPKDARYAHLIGKHIRRPLPVQIPDEEKLIPIVGDDHVDFEFGTGVLKVTPAHDKADFEIGQRHGLAAVDIMNPDGTMNALAGESLAGLDRFEARNVAVDHLRELGALVKEEPYQNNVGYSERADVPIEPRLSEQWFLKYPSVEKSRAVVADGAMKFYPERWAKVYDHWLGGIQDWCISRQLWWGHRVPVWTLPLKESAADVPALLARYFEQFDCADDVHVDASNSTAIRLLPTSEQAEKAINALDAFAQGETFDPDRFDAFPSDRALDLARDIMNRHAAGPATQDNDVLDTWFSSWLWPFATMGWPDKTDTLAKFYPTTDLVTGPDIIFFWVARMIMAGFEWMGELPFKNVYFTGIIRDKQGRKMSKSLGNSPDPLDLIAQYGADALRFGVMRSAPLGADILFDDKNVELGRNFCTKLWNATRFRQMQSGPVEGEIDPKLLTSDDKWILLRLDGAIREVSTALDEYRFSDAANALYRFFWSEFCDWYLETTKAAFFGEVEARKFNTLAVMDFVLGHTLRLFHPFLPFITEELWHGLGYNDDLPADQGGNTIMVARWPAPLDDDFKAHYGLDASDEQFANAKYEVVNLSRGLRRDFNITSGKRVRFVFKPTAPLAAHETEVLRILLNAEPLDVLADYAAPAGTPTALTPLGELYLPLEGLIDVAAERERLGKEIARVESELEKVRAKLADPNFAGKVPAKVLDEHRQREAAWAEKHAQLTKMCSALG